MKLNVVILLVSLSILSGCSHFKTTPESGVIRPQSTHPDPTKTEVEPISDTSVTPVPSPPNAENSNQLSATEAGEKIDVLERIRRGFMFPALESKDIAGYEHWNSTHASYLKNLFERAEPFLFHIVEEIEKRGLPMELALLPAVESAYKPNAVSRSSAAGLWQFVPATGAEYGLHKNWWYDARSDALASTDAALTYLSRLNKMFDGDWFLTLAAYNAGQGTVRRAIKANKNKNRGLAYQDLRLRSETRRYVPKLIALKNIINDPAKYGVTLPVIENKAHFEILELPGQVDLHKFAENSNIDLNQLLHLNAGFKRWATSPNGPHRLLIPSQDSQVLEAAKKFIAQSPKIEYRSHRIDSGDTLGGIASKYGVSVNALRTSNNLQGSSIRAGKNLVIPIRSGNLGVVDSPSTAPKDMLSAPDGKLVHRVQQGDTLWSIARHYKVQLRQLLTWNNLSTDQVLNLNQALLVFTK